jgi:hypothetical protein
VNYSDVISRAFRTLKKGSVWGFVVSIYGATLLLLGVLAVLAIAGAGISAAAVFSKSSPGAALESGAQAAVVLVVAGIVAVLVTIVLGLISYGGLIHLADEAQAGRDARIGDAWRFGARRMGRVFVVELVYGLLGFAVLLVGVVPIVLVIVGQAASNNSGAGVVVGICGGGLLLLLVGCALWMLSGFEALAIRYALIGDRTAGDAISAGWKAFRARFGNVLVMLLITLGLFLVVAFVQWIFDSVLEYATLGSLAFQNPSASRALQSGAALLRVVPIFIIVYVVAVVVALTVRIFSVSLWTAFFRQMTGLDMPAAPAYGMYPPPPPGMMPQAPQPPSGFEPTFPPPPQPPVGIGAPPEPPIASAPYYPQAPLGMPVVPTPPVDAAPPLPVEPLPPQPIEAPQPTMPAATPPELGEPPQPLPTEPLPPEPLEPPQPPQPEP